MSEESSFGVNFVEKLFGLIILAIGALSMYYVVTSTEALGDYTAFFGFLNAVLIALGLLLLLAKTE